MGATLEPRKPARVARVDLDPAHRVGFTCIFGAVLAPGPWRADPADEIDAGVELLGQVDRHFAFAYAEWIVDHGNSEERTASQERGSRERAQLWQTLRGDA